MSDRAAAGGANGVADRREGDDGAGESFARSYWLCLAEPGDRIAHGLVTALGAEVSLDLVRRWSSAERIVEHVLGGVAATDEIVDELTAAIADGLGRWLPRVDDRAHERAAARAERADATLLVPGDAAWPSNLDALGEHAPLALWVRGDASLLRQRPIALVGSRASSDYGNLVTTEIAGDLAGRGFCIVSGAAYGIDGSAHRAALAVGGATAAFLAGGVDRAYPQGHSDLIDRIADNGVLVSERPCGGQPTRWRFLQRNRLIAAAAEATVVVEAGWRSGSLNTAAHAGAIGRPLGAVPGPVTSATSAGCHRLIREFDAQCVTSADEVAELAGYDTADTASEALRDPDEIRVLDALSTRTPRPVADIARRSGLPVDQVRAVLGVLDIGGAAREEPAGWRCVANR